MRRIKNVPLGKFACASARRQPEKRSPGAKLLLTITFATTSGTNRECQYQRPLKGPMNLLFNQERLVVPTKFTPGHRRNILIQYTETVQRRRMRGVGRLASLRIGSLVRDSIPSTLFPVFTSYVLSVAKAREKPPPPYFRTNACYAGKRVSLD